MVSWIYGYFMLPHLLVSKRFHGYLKGCCSKLKHFVGSLFISVSHNDLFSHTQSAFCSPPRRVEAWPWLGMSAGPLVKKNKLAIK